MFDLLVEKTRLTEEKEECPLFIYNTFFNTAEHIDGHFIINYETIGARGGSDFLYDEEDLNDFLKRRHIKPENFKRTLEKLKINSLARDIFTF